MFLFCQVRFYLIKMSIFLQFKILNSFFTFYIFCFF
uniref:Uncharacterized protein n=1 Tax=Siphoviridae sp. ctXZx16 TaxID=2826371 RepID=A0A8S5ML45_9CAUD|nr:MAG TPA: hypothetical protein [Siphoviridae sp. ctXZx16]